MSDDRWRQIKQLAHAALLLQASDRPRFLDAACADAQTRREVESLLSHESDSFLERPLARSAAALAALGVGARLGRFEILEPLGAGGMGEVFRARDFKLGRDIAIKVLPPGLSHDRDRLARFEREAKAVAALDHPNVVTLHSVEEHDGVHFITMQLVQGQTLSELLPDEGLPLDRFFALAIPLTDAICAAHRQGITHRDLKPGNVMVGPDERLRVLDFGLAKLLDDSAADHASELPTQHLTEEGRVLGTVAYMSPEQAEGKPVDHRSDVFSLGILLYEMVTGRRPFQGETRVSTITSILRDEPTPITQLRRDAPRHLARIIKRSLAKKPGRRYQTAIDLRNELQELRRELGQEVTSDARRSTRPIACSQPHVKQTPAQPTRSGTRSGDRDGSTDSEILIDLIRRRWAPLIIGAGVLITLLVALYRTMPDRASPAANLANTQLTTLEGVELGASWSPDAGFIAVSPTLTGSADILMRPTAGGTLVPLATSERDEHTPRWSPSPERPLVAYMTNTPQGQAVYLVGSSGGSPRRLANTNVQPYHGVDARRLVGASPWSPDGESFLFARFDPQSRTLAICRIDVDSFQQRQLTDPGHGGQDRAAAWSPDGSRVVFERTEIDGSTGLWLVDAAGGEPEPLVRDESEPNGPDWLDDNTIVFSSRRAGTADLWALDLDDPQSLTPLTSGAGAEIDAVVASDGRIAYSNYNHQSNLIWLSMADPGSEPAQLTAEGQGPDSFGARIHRDGERIVYYSDRLDPGNNNLWLIARGSRSPEPLTAGPAQEIQPDWSPGGDEIVFLSNQDGPYQMWILKEETRIPRKLTDQAVFVWQVGATYSQGPRWSPDGKLIGFLVQTDGPPDLWTISPDGTDARKRLPGVLSFGWYRDGEHILYARKSPAESGAVELWAADLGTDRQARLLGAEVGEIAVAPDGSSLSYLSTVSHFARQLMVQGLRPDPATGLPLREGEPYAVPARAGAWHVHNGGWAWDSSAIIYTRDTDQGDIWVLGERQ